MNDAVRVASDGLLTTAGLAARPDFTLGLAAISPSTRTIAGPGGTADVEPRVMQVLVVLADAAGHVVTRGTLFDRCWGGVYVGDDSLNRTIGAIRKLASDVAGGSFEVETIPRTGYRLTGANAAALTVSSNEEGRRPGVISRRQLATGAAGVIAIGGLAGWSIWSSSSSRHVGALIGNAEQAIRKQTNNDQTLRDLKQAVSLRPDNAKAWGLLAFVRSLDTASADPSKPEPAANEAQAAARKALALDAREPYALLAMFELQGSTLDWATRDARLRQIIAIDPTNIPAIGELILLTQAAGLNRESWNWNERAIALDPLSFDYLTKRALKLWIGGRVADADKVIDRVLSLYPTNSWPRWVRFVIYAMTDRARAAQAMFDADASDLGDASSISLWRAALAALAERSPYNIAKARWACLAAAEAAGSFAVETTMILSALGEVDTAFEIANGFLLSRGSIVGKGKIPSPDDINDATWRVNTQYLFTPPCKVMRADARFLRLCEGMGLTDYWRARGVRPDYQLIER